jgi:hypothetical protein
MAENRDAERGAFIVVSSKISCKQATYGVAAPVKA